MKNYSFLKNFELSHDYPPFTENIRLFLKKTIINKLRNKVLNHNKKC